MQDKDNDVYCHADTIKHQQTEFYTELNNKFKTVFFN